MKKNSALYLTRGALVGALYIALCYLSSLFGLHNGVIQFRLSELLCILPVFLPEAIPGLFIGCILSNLLTASAIYDVIFGSLATLIGALGTRLVAKLSRGNIWLSSIPPIISNGLIVPFVLIYAYGIDDGYLFLLFTVTLGEAITAGFGGSLLGYSIKRTKLF